VVLGRGAGLPACAAPVDVDVYRTAIADDGRDDDGSLARGVADDDGRDVAGRADVFAVLNADLGADARRALDHARALGLFETPLFTVIDFSLPSTERRLWTFDLDADDGAGAVVVNDRVSHGSGSNSDDDPRMAARFSDTPGSLMSSLGLSRTAETYQGNNGYSLRLDGLEDSNDAMRDRAIVVHGAAYAEDEFVDDNGYLGRSSGCPAVAMSRSAAFIDLIKEGTLLFQWFPDDDWRASSPFLR
jgi:hypothetical protein